MNRLLNYKDFNNQKISEQLNQKDNIKIVEITEDGVVAENELGEKTIINNPNDANMEVTKVEDTEIK